MAAETREQMDELVSHFSVTGGDGVIHRMRTAMAEDLTNAERAWGWCVAQAWVVENMIQLAAHAPESKNYTFDTIFIGSLDALRAGLRVYDAHVVRQEADHGDD